MCEQSDYSDYYDQRTHEYRGFLMSLIRGYSPSGAYTPNRDYLLVEAVLAGLVEDPVDLNEFDMERKWCLSRWERVRSRWVAEQARRYRVETEIPRWLYSRRSCR